MPSLVDPQKWGLPDTNTSSGCFETMRVYGGKIFRLDAHLDRLYASMQHLGVSLVLDRQDLRRKLIEALAKSGISEAIVRVALIPDGRKPISQVFRKSAPSIVVRKVEMPSDRSYSKGIKVAIVPAKKFPVSQIDPQAKFSARMGSILALQDAYLRKVDEAIFLDSCGSVTESTASNFGIIKNGSFLAAPCWLGLLPGITWQAIIEVAHGLKMPVREVPLTRHDIYNADEAFLSSTIKELLPVVDIDGRRIGSGRPGTHAQRLLAGFRRLVKKELNLSRSVTGWRCNKKGQL